MKRLAIIGPTASGKTDLAIKIAKKMDSYILSIDSLSIYKEINIVSAKPSKQEMRGIKHFGIDVLKPNEHFSVDTLINIYQEVKKLCEFNNKNLIIVGGTSFYLKSLLSGLSTLPIIDEEIKNRVKFKLKNLKKSYDYLVKTDPLYMSNINSSDAYRIEKAMLIVEASGVCASEWFKLNPPKPIIKDLDIYNIEVQRDVLRERISKRTIQMIRLGLIDEVCLLEKKYTRFPNSMGAIGIVEVLEYVDGSASKEEMIQNISTHTAQLAKRQDTFNRTQFKNTTSANLDELRKLLT
ncbi:tRNA (adenosine(37)-N6)-dimethylallyltransferase MiaA [Sulfurimonas sp.]|uniref:tRNA (adenosine(37)-N6)-dimethylallyltransferase MiaA n=1 Tax=Sulfurimonas sp. TaxID=2022749 RepID=UPI002B47F35E|nr:tRNA (adenosine(37)-N6)-dimethylallyltransferase MiaA [Sulfurimonas sp.]